jgi:nucleoside-diphosphate-sugar epimerase
MIGTEEANVDNTPVSEDAPLRTKMYPYREVKEPISQSVGTRLNDYDKIAVEHAYWSQNMIDWTIIRLPMVYGPGDPDQRLQTYLRQMSVNPDAIYLKQTVAGWRNSRAFVENVAQAIRTVIFHGKSRQTYNYAEPENDTEATWISRIGKATNWSGEVRLIDDSATFGYPAVGELPKTTNFAQDLIMDSTRIRRELGFVEPISRDDALSLTIDH